MNGGIVNIDSRQEIEWLKILSNNFPDRHIEVGIRCNFDLEKMCPGETTMGSDTGRFGFCYESGVFREVIREIDSLSNVTLSGVHLHSSSKTRSINIFNAIATMACKIKEENSLDLKYIDIGGGYCGGMDGRPEYPDYFKSISNILKNTFDVEKTKIIVEPGISLISKCTTFVTSVTDVRVIKDNHFLLTDGSRFNVDPTMIKNNYLFHIETDYNKEKLKKQVVCGYTCMEVDRLMTLENYRELSVGDRIVYENVGGYTISLTPLFIRYFPSVYVKKGNEYSVVRRKWTAEDYYQESCNIDV